MNRRDFIKSAPVAMLGSAAVLSRYSAISSRVEIPPDAVSQGDDFRFAVASSVIAAIPMTCGADHTVPRCDMSPDLRLAGMRLDVLPSLRMDGLRIAADPLPCGCRLEGPIRVSVRGGTISDHASAARRNIAELVSGVADDTPLHILSGSSAFCPITPAGLGVEPSLMRLFCTKLPSVASSDHLMCDCIPDAATTRRMVELGTYPRTRKYGLSFYLYQGRLRDWLNTEEISLLMFQNSATRIDDVFYEDHRVASRLLRDVDPQVPLVASSDDLETLCREFQAFDWARVLAPA